MRKIYKPVKMTNAVLCRIARVRPRAVKNRLLLKSFPIDAPKFRRKRLKLSIQRRTVPSVLLKSSNDRWEVMNHAFLNQTSGMSYIEATD
jgi:hypothetical protein